MEVLRSLIVGRFCLFYNAECIVRFWIFGRCYFYTTGNASSECFYILSGSICNSASNTKIGNNKSRIYGIAGGFLFFYIKFKYVPCSPPRLVYNPNMGVLSKPDILKHYKAGNIVIDPFDPSSLANTSYDVRLGPYFYRQSSMKHIQTVNPFYQDSIEKMYSKVEEATPVKGLKSELNPFC